MQRQKENEYYKQRIKEDSKRYYDEKRAGTLWCTKHWD
jgi:hypothetical protein